MSPDSFDASASLHRAGRLDEAEAGYRACLDAGDARAGAALGALLLQRQRFSEAARVLEPLARARPDDAALAVNLSVALRHAGSAEQAMEQARRASVLAPTLLSAWNALGLAALQLDQAETALDAFDAGLRLAPGQPALELNRAHSLRRLGRHGDASAAYAGIVSANPGLLEAWRGLAASDGALGRVDAALRSRVRALQLAPRDREVAFEHAVALMQAGQADEAEAGFARIVAEAAGDAQAWAWLGRARLRLGAVAGARDAFERARALDPDDAVIAHFHASLSGDLPAVVEGEYIQRLFDDFADRFELTLVDRLGYSVPAALAALLREQGADAARSVLDLGCGTGLMGVELARPGRVIDGVDLSPRMLGHARAKGVYRDLQAAEAGDFLRASDRRWDLVVAADVFVYVAELAPIFDAVRARLADGGWFAFSVEASEGQRVELPPATGRYRHAPDAVAQALADAGFTHVVRRPLVSRQEMGRPVHGELLLARVPA